MSPRIQALRLWAATSGSRLRFKRRSVRAHSLPPADRPCRVPRCDDVCSPITCDRGERGILLAPNGLLRERAVDREQLLVLHEHPARLRNPRSQIAKLASAGVLATALLLSLYLLVSTVPEIPLFGGGASLYTSSEIWTGAIRAEPGSPSSAVVAALKNDPRLFETEGFTRASVNSETLVGGAACYVVRLEPQASMHLVAVKQLAGTWTIDGIGRGMPGGGWEPVGAGGQSRTACAQRVPN